MGPAGLRQMRKGRFTFPPGRTEEFSLINKYNAFVLGLSTDETDKTEYEAYLSEVIAVKAMVRADLQEAGIEVTGSKL